MFLQKSMKFCSVISFEENSITLNYYFPPYILKTSSNLKHI